MGITNNQLHTYIHIYMVIHNSMDIKQVRIEDTQTKLIFCMIFFLIPTVAGILASENVLKELKKFGISAILLLIVGRD